MLHFVLECALAKDAFDAKEQILSKLNSAFEQSNGITIENAMGDFNFEMYYNTTVSANIISSIISQSGSGTLNWSDPLPDPGRPSSASFVTLNNGTHTAVIGQPSIRPVTGDIDRPGISDVFEQQKNSPNGFSNRSEFYAAVLKNNPSITDINLVHPGQTIQVPEKSPDGTVTYHFAGGIDASVNPIAGEYLVVLPKEGGGYTLYKRDDEFTNETDRLLARHPDANVKITTFDKNDTLTGEAVAKQDGLNGEVTPIASQTHATNPDGTLATGAKASTTDVQMLANGIVQTQTTTPVTAPDGTINGTQTTQSTIVNGIPTALQTNTTVTNPTTHETTLSQDTTQYSLSGQLTGRTVISQVSNGAGEVTGGLSLSYNGAGQITATSLTQTIPNGVQQTNSTVVNGQITATTVSASAATATAPASTTQAVVFTDGQGRMTASNDRNNRLSA